MAKPAEWLEDSVNRWYTLLKLQLWDLKIAQDALPSDETENRLNAECSSNAKYRSAMITFNTELPAGQHQTVVHELTHLIMADMAYFVRKTLIEGFVDPRNAYLMGELFDVELERVIEHVSRVLVDLDEQRGSVPE